MIAIWIILGVVAFTGYIWLATYMTRNGPPMLDRRAYELLRDIHEHNKKVRAQKEWNKEDGL